MSEDSNNTLDRELTKSVALGTLCHPIDSEHLFGTSKEIFIRHRNELYRLTVTRNDKLILQK